MVESGVCFACCSEISEPKDGWRRAQEGVGKRPLCLKLGEEARRKVSEGELNVLRGGMSRVLSHVEAKSSQRLDFSSDRPLNYGADIMCMIRYGYPLLSHWQSRQYLVEDKGRREGEGA